ncbi:MAG: membrane protein insertase YidC [Bacteroidia bacterium]|nr:membrane protein insertase YidC [Bacteroidia bacterium]
MADSVLALQYGDAASAMKGTESVETIETDDIRISFSTKGGVIKEVELKHFKTYAKKPEDRKPLKLIQPQYNNFNLNTTFNGQPLDLYSLFYSVQKTTQSDTTVLTFTANLGDGKTFVQRYAVPMSGYEIGYKLKGTGLDQALAGDQLTLQWQHFMVNTEKSIKETRVQSTINYYTEDDGFDELSARSNDTEREVLSTPTQWISIKQKFFLAAIIARNDLRLLFDPGCLIVERRAPRTGKGFEPAA